MDSFDWIVDQGSSGTYETKVAVIPLGDGYNQRVTIGLKPHRRTWSIRVTCSLQTAKEIKDFLKRNAVTPFLWTEPRGEKIQVRVKLGEIKGQMSEVSGAGDISATFLEEVQ